MITVQAAFFDRNGSAISGYECSATSGEVANIDGEVVVTFTSSDAGRVVRCHTRMYTPSGQQELNNGQLTVPSGGGTFSFIGHMSLFVNTFGIGNYNIANVNLFDMNAGIDLYNGNPGGGGNCTSITFSSPPPPTTCSRLVKVQEGLGSVKVYKNNSLIATVTTSQTFTGLTDNDTLKLEAVPASGYTFQKWCDENNSCLTGNPWQLGVYCSYTYREYKAYFLQQITTVSLEVRREQGSGKVNVYQNGGYIGLLNDTETSKTFSLSSGSTFKLEAYPITGYIFEKWCDQNGCITNPDLTGTITSNQTGTNAKKVYFKQALPQYHNICSNYICTQVSGAGTNECSTVGAACGTPTPTLASITIPSTTSVQVGATKTISPVTCKNTSGSVMTCPTLTWGSGNNSIVTVSSNGVITGVSAGTMSVNCWDTVTGIASNMCTVTVTGGNGGCTNPKYKCGGTDNKYCISDNCDGTGTLPNCLNNPCGGTGVQCLPTQMNIFGTCYKKSDVAIAAGAVVLLMMLTRK